MRRAKKDRTKTERKPNKDRNRKEMKIAYFIIIL